MRPLRRIPAAVSLVAFAAVGFAFTRASESWREYRARKAADPSAAELFLDEAEMRAAAAIAALVVGMFAARLALERSPVTGRGSRVEDPGSRPE